MFDSQYEVYLADTNESRSMHHRVRYQVFCVERGFEQADAYRNWEEVDRWDRHAQQFVVHDKSSGDAVAAVRIVLPTVAKLPVEHLGCITEQPPVPVSRDQVAEISRICVVRGDGSPTVQDAAVSGVPGVRPVTPSEESEVLLGLIRAIIRYSWDSEIPYLYMLVTRPFARLLKRLGVACTQMGDGIEHRGVRAPYFIDVNRSWEGLVARSGAVAELFSRHHLAYFSHAELQPVRAPQPARTAAVAKRGVRKIAA